MSAICTALGLARRTAYYIARARPGGRYHRDERPDQGGDGHCWRLYGSLPDVYRHSAAYPHRGRRDAGSSESSRDDPRPVPRGNRSDDRPRPASSCSTIFRDRPVLRGGSYAPGSGSTSGGPLVDGDGHRVLANRMITLRKAVLYAMVALSVALGSGYVGVKLGRQFEQNILCSQIPKTGYRAHVLSTKEILGLGTSHSWFGQDKWVSEAIFPGVTNGFFLDVGSADGTDGSNTKALERRGWTGICIDPFPRNMQDRTCQVFKEVVFSHAGKRLKFHMAGD